MNQSKPVSKFGIFRFKSLNKYYLKIKNIALIGYKYISCHNLIDIFPFLMIKLNRKACSALANFETGIKKSMLQNFVPKCSYENNK